MEMEIEAQKIYWRRNTYRKTQREAAELGCKEQVSWFSYQKWRNMKPKKSIIYPELSTKIPYFISVTNVCSRFLNNWQDSLPVYLGQEPLNSVNLLVLQMDIRAQKHSSPKLLPPNIGSGWRHSYSHEPV